MTNKILLFVGPSGSGKTTAIRSLTVSMPDYFTYIPSLTTRPKREDDDDATTASYYFVGEDYFNILKNQGQLLQMTTYNGFQYGTDRADLAYATNALKKTPVLAVTEDGIQHFINAEYYPVVIKLAPYNFTPRPGREEADKSRPSLPASGFTLLTIEFDWSLPPLTRQAQMLSDLYGKLLLW